jgi:type I restriction enzyme S subunit
MADIINIPKHWQVKRLGEVCEKVEKVNRKGKDLEDDLLYLDIGGIDNNTNKIFAHKSYKWKDAPSRAQQIVFIDDILFSTVRTYMKNIAMVENRIFDGQIASSGFCVIRGKNKIISSKFIFYYSISQSFLQPLNELQTGSSYPAVRDKDVLSQPIPFPTISEQQAIVCKIEELLSDLENGKQQLQIAQQQLKIYRQSLLKWAFEGKLTNKNVKDGELPKGWKVVDLKEVVDKISDGPFGSNLKSIDYINEGIRVIRLENIGEMKFRNEYKTYVSQEKYETIQNHTVGKGDIIFSSFISESIRSVILPDYIEKAINKADCFLVRVTDTKINKKYLSYYFSTKSMRNQLVDQIHGATRPRINTTQLKTALIPFAPLKEQQLIVDELESKLTVCDKIEETISQSLLQAESLRQSILKKAFEGKLV